MSVRSWTCEDDPDRPWVERVPEDRLSLLSSISEFRRWNGEITGPNTMKGESGIGVSQNPYKGVAPLCNGELLVWDRCKPHPRVKPQLVGQSGKHFFNRYFGAASDICYHLSQLVSKNHSGHCAGIACDGETFKAKCQESIVSALCTSSCFNPVTVGGIKEEDQNAAAHFIGISLHSLILPHNS
ncbi:hypothetical protein ACRALDRAFT_1092974 [Sodiomyces alcalophilus JCM 7366]|uniref:uncharacterized protein n=1 Tax=Sodiomyces alcalophilus JCM 7366 TaxID=591952 RepID=UPI0039B5426D